MASELDDKRFKAPNRGRLRGLSLVRAGAAAMAIGVGGMEDDGIGPAALFLGGVGVSLSGFYLILQ